MPHVACWPVTNVNLWTTLHIEHSGCESQTQRAVVFAMAQFLSWGDDGGSGCWATPAELGRVACLKENATQVHRSRLRDAGWLLPSYVNGRRTDYSCAVPDSVWTAFLACDHKRCLAQRKEDRHLKRRGPLWIPTPSHAGGVPLRTGEASLVAWGTNSPLSAPQSAPILTDDPWSSEPPY